ncbi:MAG: glycine--tRNA ligase subunit beta [Thermoanaerobaculales bacterium]|nr:glycine--tRNA ligase subunit beta [Thermoanaerobaculales bacterium]
MATFVLELRCEEIPAAALPGARRQLAELFAAKLAEAGFGELPVSALSTSRRLAVVVRDLPPAQPDRREELTGPPVKVAVAADGGPTPAGEGFARKVGLPFSELQRVVSAKGEYLAATVVHRGRPTAAILAGLVPQVVAELRFPKLMRWGGGEHLFVRPVHGVVALLGDEVVPLELFGLASGRATVGHRVHAPEPFELAAADSYAEALAERAVVADPGLRRERLEELAGSLAAAAGARVHPDPELVAEHLELVEWPGLIAGRFAERFLELPPEVVITTLRHHQKCLVLEGAAGELVPGFIAVIDRRDDPEGLIRQGNEWVIGARLADAAFFVAEDRKRPLAELVPGLERLEFHRVLGSLAAKAERVGELAVTIAGLVGAAVDRDILRSAARLAKADLRTHMVGEFPELQGVIGGHYLRLEGASRELWTALRDHYTPVGFDGAVPESELGRLLGLADRLDTVAGLFAVGERPSGSKDPFALRRAAQGAVKIVAAAGWELDLGAAVAAAAHQVAEHAAEGAEGLGAALTEFIAERVRRWLTDVVGVAGDTADAVMAAGWADLPGAVARAEALERARGSASFRSLALAFKRVRNITEGQPEAAVDAALFAHAEERELAEATEAFGRRLAALLPERRVAESFAAMEPLADILERFFVAVLVMCEDGRVRSNRIALLKNLGRRFMQLADLSRLQVEGGEL